jgi:hypothetical protein
MTWVRFDDLFPIHRKVAGLSDACFRLVSEAIFWCSRNTTDGVIRTSEITQITRGNSQRAAQLVDARLWHAAGDLCERCSARLAAAGTAEPSDGWVIHDYLDHQPSRAKVEADKAAKADRQARWLASKKAERRSGDASHDASKDAAPPRPAPKGSGAGPRGAGSGRAADPENPHWRTLPAAGAARPLAEAERARRGAAAARELLARPHDVAPPDCPAPARLASGETP